ncbi:MAG: penicillin-binding protein 2, partial [Patescibacteria group bacterium]
MNWRVNALYFVFITLFILLIAKLFYWQVIRGGELSRAALSQHQTGETVNAPRGSILASDGTWLAATTQAWLIYVQKPELKESARTVANKLAPLLVDKDLLPEAMRIEGLLSKEGAVWIPITHKVSDGTKKNIEALGISGVGFQSQDDRVYPEASNAAHLLGFVGKDDDGSDRGYFGLEGFYDLSLSGKSGFVQREEDARGLPILFGSGKEVSAVPGVDIKTHIDKTIQGILEKHLKEGIERYGAISGNITIMDPYTGAVFGMAAYPSYDPSHYSEYSNDLFKNPIISDSFEPGSIFKPLVMAAGLDANVIKPDTKCDICGKAYKVDKYKIETWDGKYHADSTMTDVLVHSDNVGMAFIGTKLGADKLYDYLSKYGLGEISGIDLQGEQAPLLREKGTWNVVDLATTTFGQGIAVTPIEMIRAMATIANGGRLVKPQVVDKIIKGGWEEDVKPEVGQKVLSDKAISGIKDMMILAVKSGEAKWAVPRGFSI